MPDTKIPTRKHNETSHRH